MVPQVADGMRKVGDREEKEGEREGKGRATAGSERQINVRWRERGTEDVTGRRDRGEAAWKAQRAGAGEEHEMEKTDKREGVGRDEKEVKQEKGRGYGGVLFPL